MGKQWIRIPRTFLESKKGTKFIDILVYAAIDYQKEGNTSNIGMRTIAEKYNIPLSKVEEAIKRLKEDGFIDYTQFPSQSHKDRVYNQYTFPLFNKEGSCNKGFLMLKGDILTQNLKPKERGVLIYLQLIAMPNMNEIAETKIEEIAELIGITRQTCSKYIKYFLDINQIYKGKYFYICKYLAKDETNNKINKGIIL